MYQAETHGVRVTASPKFMDSESTPDQGRYFWAYTIEIENLSSRTMQLMTRHWVITNGRGEVHEVRGEGVIGQQPVLRPGESFEYTSGCSIATPVGTMKGSYFMQADDGRQFDAPIAEFTLAMPRTLH